MFQTFISRHNSNFFSDKLVLTSVTPASSAPALQTPKATSSTLYFDSLTVNAGNGGFLHCIQMDTSVNAANQVVSVGADIAFDADPKFFACLVRVESSSVPTTLPTAYDVYPLDGGHDGGYYTVKDCVYAHNDKSVHGVLNPTYQAGLRRDAVQPDIEAERKKRDEIEAGKSYCKIGRASCRERV